MKHIIVPLADSLGEKYNYLAAVPVAEKHFFGMVLPSEDPQPALIQEGGEDSCWMYSVCMSDHNAPEAFRAVFEALRSNIDPYGGDSFTVDVVVDAAHAALAEKTLAAIRKAGQWYLVHIIFLSERNSPYGEQQSSFFTKIHNDSSGRFEDSGLGWTWFTMLSDENRNGATGESIRKQREELLPFILCEDHHNEKPHSCFTYAVNYQLIQEQRIPEIPRIQTIRFACRALQAHEVYNEIAVLLMNGDVCPDQTDKQLAILRNHLIENAGLKTITGQDLLIHKHDPKADFTTRELLERLLKDNPNMDSRRYDQAASENQLNAMPYVRKAVAAWEDYVVTMARMHTEPEKIRDQLANDSEWVKKISKEFQSGYFADDPLQMCASTIRGKDGYEEAAANNALSDIERVNRQLQDAFFQACLRLLVLQIRHTLFRINDMITERENAIQELLHTAEGCEDIEEMTRGWCERVRGKLTEISNTVPIDTTSAENTREVLDRYIDVLMEHLKNQIDVEEGYAEMASPENTDRLMRTMQDTMPPVQLVNSSLTGNASIQRDEKWFVYDHLHSTYDAERTMRTVRPLIMQATAYYLYPAADTAPNPERDDYQRLLFLPSVQVRMNIANRVANRGQIQDEKQNAQEKHAEDNEKAIISSLRFNWDYPQSDTVCIKYYLYGSQKPLTEIQRSKTSFGGSFVVHPAPNLPSGARIEIEICFLKAGHEIGKVPERLYYETEKLRLTATEEIYAVKEGLFRKVNYHRLRVSGTSSELTGRLAVQNAISECICSQITWTKDGSGIVSEPLPDGGAWCLANCPDSPYVFELN